MTVRPSVHPYGLTSRPGSGSEAWLAYSQAWLADPLAWLALTWAGLIDQGA